MHLSLSLSLSIYIYIHLGHGHPAGLQHEALLGVHPVGLSLSCLLPAACVLHFVEYVMFVIVLHSVLHFAECILSNILLLCCLCVLLCS